MQPHQHVPPEDMPVSLSHASFLGAYLSAIVYFLICPFLGSHCLPVAPHSRPDLQELQTCLPRSTTHHMAFPMFNCVCMVPTVSPSILATQAPV